MPAPVPAPVPAVNPFVPRVPLKNKKQAERLKAGLGRSRSFDSMNGKEPVHVKKDEPKKDRPAKRDPVAARGKINPAPKKGGRASQSQRAGIVFPVSRITKSLRAQLPTNKVRKTAGVFTAAVMEYMAYELLDVAAELTRRDKKVRITEDSLNRAIKAEPFFK
jgi:histone H3/H4